jgi:hypothetical protein
MYTNISNIYIGCHATRWSAYYYVSSYYCTGAGTGPVYYYVSSYYILLYTTMCPHTSVRTPVYSYMCVLILVYVAAANFLGGGVDAVRVVKEVWGEDGGSRVRD